MSTKILDDLISSQKSQKAVTLPSGLKVKIKRLRTIELLQFVRLLSEGMSGQISALLAAADADDSGDGSAFGDQILLLAMTALPYVPEFTVEWVRGLVEPSDPRTPEPKFYEYFSNPTWEDTIGVVQAVMHQEREEFASLGKRMREMVSSLGSRMEARDATSSEAKLTPVEDG